MHSELPGLAGGSGAALPPDAPPRQPFNLALGVERIGLIALKFPRVIAVIAALLSIWAAFGVDRIKVDDSLSQLFRSNTPEFKQYEEVTRRFPSSEFDVLVVVEGKQLLTRSSLLAHPRTEIPA